MADAMHNRSRREVLGAAVGLPLVGSVQAEGPLHHASHGPPPRAGEELGWRSALAAYEAAEGELRGYERFCAGRSFEEQGGLEPGYDARSEATYSALRRMLMAPAPDVAALADKLDRVVEHEVGTLDGGEDCLAAIRSDARRLAGQGAVRR